MIEVPNTCNTYSSHHQQTLNPSCSGTMSPNLAAIKIQNKMKAWFSSRSHHAYVRLDEPASQDRIIDIETHSETDSETQEQPRIRCILRYTEQYLGPIEEMLEYTPRMARLRMRMGDANYAHMLTIGTWLFHFSGLFSFIKCGSYFGPADHNPQHIPGYYTFLYFWLGIYITYLFLISRRLMGFEDLQVNQEMGQGYPEEAYKPRAESDARIIKARLKKRLDKTPLMPIETVTTEIDNLFETKTKARLNHLTSEINEKLEQYNGAKS